MLDYKVCSECSKKIPWGPDDEINLGFSILRIVGKRDRFCFCSIDCLKDFVRHFEDDETNSLE
jgi:hypothetical protein